jgi:hypothetical protein
MMDEAKRRARAEELARFLAKQARQEPDAPFALGEPYRVHTPWGMGTLPEVSKVVPLWTTYYGTALGIIEREERDA